jgi:hypothetical protein
MKAKISIIAPVFMAVMLTALSCSTGEPPVPPPPPEKVNVILYDKDTTTIESYIQGKWQRVYHEDYMNRYEDDGYFIKFTANNFIISPDIQYGQQDTLHYMWYQEYIGGNYEYIMKTDGFTEYQFYEIKNDTLIFGDFNTVCAPFTYYCVKINN